MKETLRATMLHLGALASLARANVLGDVDILTHPEREAAHQRPSLGPTKVTSQRPIMALAQHLGTQIATGGNA